MVNKPKKVDIISWINTGIFPATIMFVQGFTYEKVVAYLKKEKAEVWQLAFEDCKDVAATGCWFASKRTLDHKANGKRVCYFIVINGYFDFSDYDYCRLAHEVLHICQYMMPDFLNRMQEHEAEAYTHTHIMQQCLKKIRGE